MTEKLRQSLSAVIDDEADAFELRRVLDELGRDDGLRALWDRYHLIGNALRGEPPRLPSGLRDRVWAALEAAPEAATGDADAPSSGALDRGSDANADPAPQPGSRLGRYTGLAVAASVAFAVVIGFNGLGSGDGEAPGAGTPATSVAASGATVGAGNAEDDVRRAVLGPEVSPVDVQRAQAYMLHHTQQQALNQAGVMSFVKLATYEAP